jgi:hypothetical protein
MNLLHNKILGTGVTIFARREHFLQLLCYEQLLTTGRSRWSPVTGPGRQVVMASLSLAEETKESLATCCGFVHQLPLSSTDGRDASPDYSFRGILCHEFGC